MGLTRTGGPQAGGADRAAGSGNNPCINCQIHHSRPHAAAAFASLGAAERVPAGKILWNEGDLVDRVALVCRGVVLTSIGLDGQRRTTGIEVTGAFLGCDASVWTGRRPAEALTLTPTSLLVVPAEAFREAFRRGGATALALGEILSRNCSTCIRLFSVGYGAVPERLARVLLQVQEAHSTSDLRGTFVPVPLSRTQLADLIGCRVETLIRALKTPPLSDIIVFQREGFVISSLGALQRLAAGSTP